MKIIAAGYSKMMFDEIQACTASLHQRLTLEYLQRVVFGDHNENSTCSGRLLSSYNWIQNFEPVLVLLPRHLSTHLNRFVSDRSCALQSSEHAHAS